MPKQVITKEQILNAALEMTRRDGFESINARSLAEKIGCSVQPIYSYYSNMEHLKEELYASAFQYYRQFIERNMDRERFFQSMGEANIKFAKTEAKLFKLLFLIKQNGLNSFADLYEKRGNPQAVPLLSRELKLLERDAQRLYILMLIFTQGISTMLATGGANICDEEISGVMEEAYRAFLASFTKVQ